MCKNATQDASKSYVEYVQGGLLYLWDQQCTQNSHDNWFLYYLNNI